MDTCRSILAGGEICIASKTDCARCRNLELQLGQMRQTLEATRVHLNDTREERDLLSHSQRLSQDLRDAYKPAMDPLFDAGRGMSDGDQQLWLRKVGELDSEVRRLHGELGRRDQHINSQNREIEELRSKVRRLAVYN